MSRPTSANELPQGVVTELETGIGSGEFLVDSRVSAEEIVLESGEHVSRARFAVGLDEGFGPRQAREHYHPGLRVVVRTDEHAPEQRHMLFDGYVSEFDWSWSGETAASAAARISALHVSQTLASHPTSQVFGRAVRSLEIERGLSNDSSSWLQRSERITALPCLFNPDGRGNRSGGYLQVTDSEGTARAVPIFVDDDASDGSLWTFGDILRYLGWFHLPRGGAVEPGNLFEITGFLDVPGTNVSMRSLLECPRDLLCEATSFLEAMVLVAAEAGLHFHVETVNSSGRARSALRIWDPAKGAPRRLNLGAPTWDGVSELDSQSADDSYDSFLTRNNTHRGTSVWRHDGVVTFPLVIGGVKKYEILAEMNPGWLPVAELDDVASVDRSAMKDLALLEEVVRAGGPDVAASSWYRRFHRQGAEFAANQSVSRIWVLNESGEYDAAYNRNAPFDSYQAFDFATAIGAETTDAGQWMRRRRRLLPVPATSATTGDSGVRVEVSFDSGQTWSEPNCEYTVLAGQCGIELACVNPTDIHPPGTDRRQQNLWFAMIDGTFRLRVRALLESDHRIVVRGQDGKPADRTLIASAVMVYRPDGFAFTRSNAGTVDDTGAAQRTADRMASRLAFDERRVLAAVPWVDRVFAIGDRLVEPLGIDDGGPRSLVLSKRIILSANGVETELLGGQVPMSREAG